MSFSCVFKQSPHFAFFFFCFSLSYIPGFRLLLLNLSSTHHNIFTSMFPLFLDILSCNFKSCFFHSKTFCTCSAIADFLKFK